MENSIENFLNRNSITTLKKEEELKEFLIEEESFYFLWNATDKVIEVYWKGEAFATDYELMLTSLVKFANYKSAKKVIIDQTNLLTNLISYTDWKRQEMLHYLINSTQIRILVNLSKDPNLYDKLSSNYLNRNLVIGNFDSFSKASEWLNSFS